MKRENAVLRENARASLDGKWGLAIGTFVVYILILVGISFLQEIHPILSLGSIIVAGPFGVGVAIFSLSIARNEEAALPQIFEGFQNFTTALFANLLMILFIFLWTLLLIIPGIIAAFSYAMTYYIIADNPDIGPMEAIDKSKEMMDGHKMDYFMLSLWFFGLALLCILTLGIGFFWLMPYMSVTIANFYNDIKGDEVLETATA